MSNVFVVGSPYMNYTSALCYALKRLGHTVYFHELEFFDRTKLSKSEYLKWRFNKKSYEYKFYNTRVECLKNKIKETNADVFIYFQGLIKYDYMNSEVHTLLKEKKIKSIVWFMDAIKHCLDSNRMLHYYDVVYSFEKSDVEYYGDRGVLVSHLPIGVDSKIYCSGRMIDEKKIDICFVGNPTHNRLILLESIAKYAFQNGLKMVVFGGYWTTRYKWKECLRKWQFKNKYPYLFRCVINKIISPQNTSEVYLESKICLNIHTSIHNGCNPRTFEILGNGNFELVDFRDEFEDLGLKDGVHLAVYNNVSECIDKIDYYLGKKHLRDEIGNNGKDLVLRKYTFENLLKEKL